MKEEKTILFNDALSIFSFMVKNHRANKRGNSLLPLHELLFLIRSRGSFICIILHSTAYVTPVVEHWLEQEQPSLYCWCIKVLDVTYKISYTSEFKKSSLNGDSRFPVIIFVVINKMF